MSVRRNIESETDESARSYPSTVSSGERRNLLERYLLYRRARSSLSADMNMNPSLSVLSSSMIRPIGVSRFHPSSSPALTASTSSPFSSSSVSVASVYPESPFMLPSSHIQLNSLQAISTVDLGESHTIEERLFSSMTTNNNFVDESQALRETQNVRRNTTVLSALSREARRENDAMVYLEGPCVYSCINCRTHLTTHDDIISKSFHGRNGRAFLFENCTNIIQGPAEDRRLLTGLHSVCDISCKRCKTLIGWTYEKAYESSQKYKEGKFIVEKFHLFMEENSYYDVDPPACERRDQWRLRSMSRGKS